MFVATQIVARLKRRESDRGNGTISDKVSLAVALQTCGAPGSADKRPRAFVALVSEALLRGTRPL